MEGNIFYPLFEHMANEHGLTLTDTELGDIIHIVREMDKPKTTWHSVKDRPLVNKLRRWGWIATPDGMKDFIAAVQLVDGAWWTRHCVLEDEIGLCVVGDACNDPAGWNIEDITHWTEYPSDPA